MKKRLHYSRQLRQLKYCAKQIQRLKTSGGWEQSGERKRKDLLQRLRRLYQQLQGLVTTSSLRKAVAGVALVFGLSLSANAQVFAPPVDNPFSLGGFSGNMFPNIIDIDNDGDMDILGTGYDGYNYGPSFIFYENIGTADAPQFGAYQSNPFNLSPIFDITTCTFGDLDDDGDMDIIAGDYQYGGVTYFENIGDAENPDFQMGVPSPFGLPLSQDYATPELGDLDGDGDLDLLVGQAGYYGGYDVGQVRFFENTGTPEVAEFAAPVDSPYGMNESQFVMLPRLADLDGDCDLDFMFGNLDYYYYSGYISYQENLGTPETPDFGEAQTNPFLIEFGTFFPLLALGDIDADGDVDLLSGANYYGGFQYFENIANDAIGANSMKMMMEDESVTFELADFNYDDSNGSFFNSIRIIETAQVGSLELLGNPINDYREISTPDIDLGNITYTPNPGEFGDPYDSFTFKVSNDDGEFSDEIYTMTIVVSEVSSTSQAILEGEFQLSPNPVSQELLLQADLLNNAGKLDLEIRNMLGQVIETRQLVAGLSIRETVEVSQLSAGAYTLTLRGKAGVKTLRFIKQ